MTNAADTDYRPDQFDLLESNSQRRLIVGIIGHSILAADQLVHYRQQCNDALRSLQARHPSRTLEIISALAPGAERIGAQAALDLGLRLIVLLPPDSLMLGDPDASAESSAEYRRLLTQVPIQNFQIPAPDTHGDSGACCVADLTRLIVSESQALIALWDGGATEWPGDTADLVDAKLRPRTYDLPDIAAGPVLHLPVAREDGSPVCSAVKPGWLYPDGSDTAKTADRRKRFPALV